MIMFADEDEDRGLKLKHISEETPAMIFHRSLKIDRCLSSIKYHILFDQLDDAMIEHISGELDYIWYQLGIRALHPTQSTLADNVCTGG
jgi:hypothetical protein